MQHFCCVRFFQAIDQRGRIFTRRCHVESITFSPKIESNKKNERTDITDFLLGLVKK